MEKNRLDPVHVSITWFRYRIVMTCDTVTPVGSTLRAAVVATTDCIVVIAFDTSDDDEKKSTALDDALIARCASNAFEIG